jgi:hypothetical protein
MKTFGDGTPVPQVTTFLGEDVQTMSRERLIEAVIYLGTALNEANASAAAMARHFATRLRGKSTAEIKALNESVKRPAWGDTEGRHDESIYS